MANKRGKNGNSDRFYCLVLQNHSHKIKRPLLLGRKATTKLDSVFESRDITLPTWVHLVKAMFFSSSHVWTWELDHKEGWVPKKWCFQIVVLEKTLESPLDSKEIKSVNPKRKQPRIFIGRTDTEVPTLWPSDLKSQLIGEDPDVGKDWGQEVKGVTELYGWMASLTQLTYEFEQTLGDSEGQGSLACCSPWGCIARRDLATKQQQSPNLSWERVIW